MRPASAWEDVLSVFNRRTGKSWTVERLKRAVRRAAREGFIDAKYLSRSPRKPGDDRLVMLVAGIALANPELSLRAIGAQLEAMRERTPHGGRQWSASSVKNLLDQARKMGVS